MFTIPFLKPVLNSSLTRFVLIGSLTGIGIVSGVAPNFEPSSSTWSFQAVVRAQDSSTFSDEEVGKYAQIVLLIEVSRQQTYEDIKRLIGSETVPEIECHQLDAWNPAGLELDEDEFEQISAIAKNYCDRALTIVTQNELTANRFNTITTAAQASSDLKTRIQDAMIELQQNPSQ